MLRRLLDSPRTYFVAAGLLLVAGVASQFEVNLPSRPKGGLAELEELRTRDDVNVVFILVDTLRADRLSAYGHERVTSPILDSVARTGVRFAHVQSQSSWTKASMASLWSGLYPRRIGVTRFDHSLSETATLPAEILRDAGFRTAGIYRNGWVDANFGFGQGFEIYLSPRPSATPLRMERGAGPSAAQLQGSDVDATHAAREFLRSHGHERFFLYLHYMDVHQYLYAEESGLFGTDIRDVYDNAIHWTDRNVSAVLAELDSRDLLDRTLVVIAADHGEQFYEHGGEGHAQNLYREVTETPWILVLPFRLDPGVVIEQPAQNVDVWPTVLDLLGFEFPGETDGRSMVPLIRAALGGPPPPEELLERRSFAELDRFWGKADMERIEFVSVVDGPYHLVEHFAKEPRVELYDRLTDPTEQRDVSRAHPDLVESLRESASAYRAHERIWDSPLVELDEMRIGQLRALGYVIEPGKTPKLPSKGGEKPDGNGEGDGHEDASEGAAHP
jgi:arylsulfatase A-like enzyme